MLKASQIGCQTYTWEMHGDDWKGTPDDILDAIAAAGYAGVEFSNNMLGPYVERPYEFKAALEKRGLRCAVYAYATTGFTDPEQRDADLAGARKSLEFSRALGVPLCLGGAASATREDDAAKLERAIRFYSEVAELGRQMGVLVCVHPHSHHGSLLESAEEYDRLLSATAATGLRFQTADTLFAAARTSWTVFAATGIESRTCISRTWIGKATGNRLAGESLTGRSSSIFCRRPVTRDGSWPKRNPTSRAGIRRRPFSITGIF
jgi:Xylose isomerase-like TIM barrel